MMTACTCKDTCNHTRYIGSSTGSPAQLHAESSHLGSRCVHPMFCEALGTTPGIVGMIRSQRLGHKCWINASLILQGTDGGVPRVHT